MLTVSLTIYRFVDKCQVLLIFKHNSKNKRVIRNKVWQNWLLNHELRPGGNPIKEFQS